MNRKKCQYQVREKSKENILFYCLGFKEYLSRCPVKCPLLNKGKYISMDVIYQGKYEMECPYFHVMVQIGPLDEKLFVCGKLGGYPNCNSCSFESNQCLEKKTNHI